MTRVSVVVPTYNRADVLPRAIDSALAQTIDDVEVVVVDDASTEDIESVVDRYGDRVRYLAHETNRNGSAARNTGIRNSTGEYVAFLDSDDEWRPEKLERQLECLEERGDEWVAAYCGFERLRSGRTKHLRALVAGLLPENETIGREGGEELIRDSLLLNGFSTGGMSTLVVERDVLEEMDGFDESFERQQDWEFRNRLLRHGRLACVDEPLVVKHQSAGGPSAETVKQATEHYLATFDDEIRTLEAEGYDVVGIHYVRVAQFYFADGQFGEGVEYFRRSNPRSAHDWLELGYAVASGVSKRVRSSE